MEDEGRSGCSIDFSSSSIPDISLQSSYGAEFVISDVSEAPEQKTARDEVLDNGTGAPARTPVDLIRFASSAAVKLQKVYRSYRTRRMLADSAVVAEELWWQALDYARLNRSTISFFKFSKPETIVSRWNRVSSNASRVGKGLSIDSKAQKLAFQHWIEAIDPRHRYVHNLHNYFDEWRRAKASQPFFYWLDVGDGKEVDIKDCPRSKLRKQCIKYLGPKEREHYEYTVSNGRILHKLTGKALETNNDSVGSKWIFAMSTSKRLYTGEKKKGLFHHSSFLAGGAILAAGQLVAEDGVLKSISAYSGHYRPNDDSLNIFSSFLRENGVLDVVQIRKPYEDYHDNSKVATGEVLSEPAENGLNSEIKGDPKTVAQLHQVVHQLSTE